MQNSFVRVPPDGAGKRIQTTQHTISGNTVEIQHIHISDLDQPDNTLEINNKGAALVSYSEGEPLLDSYNNLKISSEGFLGVYLFSLDSYDDLFFQDLGDGGTQIYYSGTSSISLTTSASSSKSRRTSNRYHYYQPGSFGKVTIVSSCGDTGKDNNCRKWGLHDDYNGIFFALSGQTLCVGYRSNMSGSVVDTYIPQSTWNGDKLNGSGLTQLTLDVTKSYQYFIEYSWPSGMARFGIHHPIHGRITCHTLVGSGTGPLTLLRIASLPVRFSNKNVGAVGGGSQLNILAATVQTNNNVGYTFWRYGDLECTNKSVSSHTPIMSFRPKVLLDNGVKNRVNTFPETLSIFSSGATIKISLIWCHDELLTGSTWTLASDGGPLEADSGATSIAYNSPDYWVFKTFYITKDTPMNIDLTPFFELNDEGVLLTGGETNSKVLSVVGTVIGAGTASVSMTMSYRGLY
jgi:hypothetical protein